MNALCALSENTMDTAYEQISDGQVCDGMRLLHEGLNTVRRELPVEGWREVASGACRAHPIRELLHQDPFTLRSFEKPRGYAGDAELLDFLYGETGLPDSISELGRKVSAFMNEQPSARSVRARRALLSRELDALAERVERPRVLSIACGHLREAQRSRAVTEGRIAEYVAFDQDTESLAFVERTLPGRNIRTVRGSVRNLLAGQHELADFDFVYSAGLFDYLAPRTGACLAQRMFSMLRPGGRMWVANFCKDISESGYMESFMDWWLLLRDEAEVELFAEGLPAPEIASRRIFRDEIGKVIYLEVVKGS